MTATAFKEPVASATRRPRRIAVMPAYNEEATIIAVLDRLEPLADELIIVDDGSVDRTRELLIDWCGRRSNVKLICFNQNRGMSAAYYRAFQELGRRQQIDDLDAGDIVLTVDADGQHDPEEIDALIEHMESNRLDAVIARRDLEVYTAYKRLGNFLMSLWASLWAGKRLYDVESGYRAFRLGALTDALRYYKGYRYSETVEVAVILARLGYRIDNSYLVPVPIFRSNTRLKDVAIDLAAIPAAAWRLNALRNLPAGLPLRIAYYGPLLAPLALALMAVDVLSHRLFLADDSMQHYSHVWYLSTQLFQHGRLPLHFAALGGGMTFPYGLVPYLVGSVLYQPLGDWGTTLLMVVAFLGVVWAAGLARPQLHNPWLLLFFVANPFFIDILYSFQFASAWSSLFFFLLIWSFERDRPWLAAALLWLCVSSHPLIGCFGLAGYGLYLAWLDQARLRRFLVISLATLPLLLPVLWMTWQTPAASESSAQTIVLSLTDSVLRRGTVLFLPLLLPLLSPFLLRNYLKVLPVFAVLVAAGLAFNLGLVRIADLNRGSYAGALQGSANTYDAYFASAAFQPDAVYRVVETTNREDGAYRFLQHGATLANEFFSEGVQRRDWSESQFACYARFKGLQYDVIESAYTQTYHKNENALLGVLVGEKEASVAYTDPAGRFVVYDLHQLVSASTRPASLSDCGL